ncbi:MAG: PD-(D/E)XK nuclease family protein [Nitrospirae bacterium]|nr:PD-(D/E)XK nuclease family protein [Nitrospirota bacterium]
MKSVIIPYSKDLIEEVYNHLVFKGKDYSNNIVVFPGRRPAHFLRKYISHKLKSAAIPPEIFSIDEFISSLNTKVTRKLEPIDAVAILYKINQGISNYGQPFGKSGMSPDEFFQLGQRIFDDIEELYIECVEPLKIRDIGYISGIDIPQKSVEFLQTIFTFYSQFYKICKESGYSTRSIQYRDAADTLSDISINRPIIFAGFFALSKSENVIFKGLSSTDNVTFIFQQGSGIDEILKEFNIEPLNVLPENKPQYHFYKSPDTHGQVFALSSLLNSDRGTIYQAPTDDINSVIVLPSTDTLFALYNHVLTPMGEDNYNISMGYPLIRTPLYSFINSLIEVITSSNEDRIYVPDYLKFVLHPYTKNIYFYGSLQATKGRADITRIIFHRISDWFTRNRAKMFVSLNDLENDKNLIEDIIKYLDTDITSDDIKNHLKAIHDQTIRKFITFINTQDFANKTIEILTYIYDHSTAKVHPFFYPFSEAFISSLNIISNSLFGELSFHHVSGYFNLFKKFINTRRIPFEGTPLKGIQTLGVLETRNLKFKNVYVLDMNEGVIPHSNDNSLIPLRVKKALGLPIYKDNVRLIEYYLDILFKGAEKVHLFYVENSKTEPSRFIERLLWERQKEAGRIEIPESIESIQYNIELTTQLPKPIIKTKEVVDFLRDFSYSPTALDTYLRCEQQFYYHYVLGLKEREEMSGNIERMDIGSLVHAGLKEYFTPFVGKKLTPQSIELDSVDEIIDKIFNVLYGYDLSGAVYLLKHQIIYQLRRFLEFYQIPKLCNSHYIIGLEKPYKAHWNGFNLNGKIDRIDRCNGRINIIDYKTSSRETYLNIRFIGLEPLKTDNINQSNRHIITDNIKSIQLIFYTILYSTALNIDVDGIDCMFLLLGKSGINNSNDTIEKALFIDKGQREYYKTLTEIMLFLLREITDINIPFRSETMSCTNCVYTNICGV